MRKVLDRLFSAIVGIIAALAGLALFIEVSPNVTGWRRSDFNFHGMGLMMFVVSILIIGAFAMMVFGAFVLSYRMLRYAITGRKREKKTDKKPDPLLDTTELPQK